MWSPRAWMMISVRCRYFSLVRMTCAEMTLSLRSRPRRTSRRSMSCRMGGVMSRCRPVMSSRIGSKPLQLGWSAGQRRPPRSSAAESPTASAVRCRLEQHLSLIRRGGLEFLAILRDGPSREHEPFLLQDADDLGIAQRLARVFVLDDLPDALLDRDRRDALAVRTGDAGVEEVLHLEHPLRGVHVLVVEDRKS